MPCLMHSIIIAKMNTEEKNLQSDSLPPNENKLSFTEQCEHDSLFPVVPYIVRSHIFFLTCLKGINLKKSISGGLER